MPDYDNDALDAAEIDRPGIDFQIKKLYLKDSSFESPNSPRVFATRDWNPNVDFHLHTETGQFGASTYEVTLRATVTVTNAERTLYLAEVSVAGLFEIGGIAKDALPPLLGSYCPSILFSLSARSGVGSLGARRVSPARPPAGQLRSALPAASPAGSGRLRILKWVGVSRA